MHIIDQTVLGALIILLLATLVVIKRMTTGSILEKPNPGLLLWLVNIFNLFFLLIANPLAAILLVAGRMNNVDPTSVEITPGWLMVVVELLGLVIYLAGFFLMGWALIRLGKSYQLGGSDPRTGDRMIVSGPYGIIRHPMYTAALSIAFGLACLTGSLACLGAFVIYFVLIILLIPVEEESLIQAYGEEYGVYRRKTGKLIPVLR